MTFLEKRAVVPSYTANSAYVKLGRVHYNKLVHFCEMKQKPSKKTSRGVDLHMKSLIFHMQSYSFVYIYYTTLIHTAETHEMW